MNLTTKPAARGTQRGPRVLMLGTAPGGRGGVATVVGLLRQQGLFEREAVRYVATHVDGSQAAKARAALSGFWHTLTLCLRARPTLVHAHAASHASFVRKSLLLLVARRSGCKTIFHLHGASFDHYATACAGPLMRRWIRHTLEASSIVIALSERWAAFVRAFAPRATVTVVPNPVPLPPLADAGAEQPGRILFLGQVEPRKGVYELLEALPALLASHPQLQLAIGGQGELDQVRRRAAELGVGEQVVLLGWLDGTARQAELARAAVVCLPSHAEGLPMAMLEAMAAGKPVVASAVGGIPDAIRHRDNGLLVTPGDAAQLAGALATVLGDDALRRRLGQRARATVAARFEAGIVTGQLSALYRDLCAAGVR